MYSGKVTIFTNDENDEKNLIKKIEHWGYSHTYFPIKNHEIPDMANSDLVIFDLTKGFEVEGIQLAGEVVKTCDAPVIYIADEGIRLEFEHTNNSQPYYFVYKPYGDNELKFAVDMAVYRSKKEQNLREDGNNSKLLFDRAPIAYQSLDEYGNILHVNDIWLEKLGYTKDQVIGKWFGDFLGEECVDHFRMNFPNFKSAGEVHDVVFDMVQKDGGMITVSFDGRIGYDEDGNFKQTHCIFQDITEQRRMEEALMKSEQYYKTIFENTGTATLIVEADTKVSLVNAEFVKLYGKSKEIIEGQMEWPQFVSKEYIPMMKEFHATRRIDPDAVPRNYEFDFMDSSGNIKNVHTTVAIIPGTSKSLISLLDVTEQRTAEKKLKSSLQDKDLLLREIHHRVKNNLQIISSLLNLQSRYIQDEDALNVFTESQNRVKSMAIIHEKLYKSRSMSKIDFEEYITDLTDSLFYSYHINPSKAVLVKDIDKIFFDVDTAIPCGLIINELITNCLKHAFPDDTSGTISIKLLKVGEDYLLSVADDGAGFPEEIDFQNTESLGLQLVNNLVNQLDGTIELDRSNGTRFKILFKELSYKKRV